jgi:ketosteroid isomerase-like protein
MNFILSLLLMLTGLMHVSNLSTDSELDLSSDNEAAVEETVTEFFNAMRESDGDGMEAFLTPDATLHTVVLNEEGEAMLRQTEIAAFMNSVNQSDAGALDEQLTSFTAHVDGNLSTAWMDYSFYYNGEFSHCGVNTMNLIQTESGWKIFSIVDTRRQEGC